MAQVNNHNDTIFGTVLGTVLNLLDEWNRTQFADEFHAMKLAAIGAATGFAVTLLLKFLHRKFSKRTSQ